jgi:Tfp pilus assembly protein PilF
MTGDRPAAEAYFAEALAAAEALGDERVVGIVLNAKGLLAVGDGDLAAASELFHRACALSERTGDVQAEARALSNLGVVHMHAGEVDAATVAFERSLRLARVTGNRGAEAAALQNLAWATQARSGATARDFLYAAVEIFDELGYRRELANALMSVPAIAVDRGEGLRALARAESVLREMGDHDGVAGVAQVRSDFLEGCS